MEEISKLVFNYLTTRMGFIKIGDLSKCPDGEHVGWKWEKVNNDSVPNPIEFEVRKSCSRCGRILYRIVSAIDDL